MKKYTELINDPHAYLESAGRFDKSGLTAALSDGGESTVIRACLWRN